MVGDIVDFGRGLDAGEMTREEEREAFGQQVGSNPSLMAQIIACQRGFVEFDIDRFRIVLPSQWDLEGTGDGSHGSAA